MTSQFEFSDRDWKTVASAPVLVGLAVAKAVDSGVIGSWRETRALDRELNGDAPVNPASAMIEQAAATDLRSEIVAAVAQQPSDLATTAVATCVELNALLTATAEPEEARGYKAWVLDVANEVAAAAKEGGIRVSPGEAELIDRIRFALDMD